MLYGSLAPPRYHEFLVQDINIMYSYKTEQETVVPMMPLLLISIGFPIAQFFVCTIFESTYTSTSRLLWDLFSGILCLWGAISTQLLVTVILKNICGLPRPDFLARCQPDILLVPSIQPFQLLDVSICANPNFGLIQEGLRSFPSGHLSTVFCSMVISSLNIAGKLQVFDKRGISFKVLLAIFPIMIALFVSCTRVSDNRHYLRDVFGGSVIGTHIGVWFYLQYFPSVTNLANSGRAYPPRRIGVAKLFNNVGGFWKINDNLAGAYDLRALNAQSSIDGLRELLHENDTESLEAVPKNIQAVNKLTKEIKGCIDIQHHKIHTGSMTER